MSVAIVTGSGGLIGSEATKFLAGKGLSVVGIDNDTRGRLFGTEASTRRSWTCLTQTLPSYSHVEIDICNIDAVTQVFAKHGRAISLVIHAAGQPSHDWAARQPMTDFSINANGTLTLLEATRQFSPDAVFIFCSTNKVYGDTANRLPLVERGTRWELAAEHSFFEHGINESMSIDGAMHSLLGVSKCAADLLVQEYGRYFAMKTACFRAGCLTGPGHNGAHLHGFLSYLVRCAVKDEPYRVLGYKGKQVRDNLHASDLVKAFWLYFQQPRFGEVYNSGGSRVANCSVLEAIKTVQDLSKRSMRWSYEDKPRLGDHIWWISDVRRFQSHYPTWRPTKDIAAMLAEIHAGWVERGL